MPFTIVRDDICRRHADAIVCATNNDLRDEGGVTGAIFAAAGRRRLTAACRKIGHVDTGDAVATKAYSLRARHIIHTAGPVWHGQQEDEDLLRSCYRASLELATALGDKSIAFPLISCGHNGFPVYLAARIAREEISAYLTDHDLDVTLAVFGSDTLEGIGVSDVKRYIDDAYVSEHIVPRRMLWEGREGYRERLRRREAEREERRPLAPSAPPMPEAPTAPSVPEPPSASAAPAAASVELYDTEAYVSEPAYEPDFDYMDGLSGASAANRMDEPMSAPSAAPTAAPSVYYAPMAAAPSTSLDDRLRKLDAGFSETLLALIDARNMTDAEVYKRANMTRQHFSKIRNNRRYRPKKETALALAIALRLTLDETEDLLSRAGYVLTHASKRDIIVEYHLIHKIYDINVINICLFDYDQPLLG